MRESEHFNLFLAEGNDIVNPLVQDVQNYEKIDGQMFKNQNAGVQNATELKNGTVHAITRNVPDAQFITFTATSNYTSGETFTVDGVQVTALTVSGETLPTGAYVINSQVLCVLKGTLLTVYGVASKVADNSLALNGHPDTYFGTKEEVDNAIDTANAANELVKDINHSLTQLREESKLKLLGNANSSASIDISKYINDYSELLISVTLGVTSYRITINIPTAELVDSDITYQSGSRASASVGTVANVMCSRKHVILTAVIVNDNNVLADSTLRVYGRK